MEQDKDETAFEAQKPSLAIDMVDEGCETLSGEPIEEHTHLRTGPDEQTRQDCIP